VAWSRPDRLLPEVRTDLGKVAWNDPGAYLYRVVDTRMESLDSPTLPKLLQQETKQTTFGSMSRQTATKFTQQGKIPAKWQTSLEMSEKCPLYHLKMSLPQGKFAIQPKK
jgi:hypothetical protein